ncbi:MAG: hypothetical protein F6K64_27395 [Moorea sp. SIO3A2]|uniref:hypothetical protein n=1 Tax=Moorena producens TaxID=1155739 RepID=UPI0002E70187|nr:hypothetical protein [Moorena producens]NER90561.1 hypothetical protein [Moorena sp. SIO3A2]
MLGTAHLRINHYSRLPTPDSRLPIPDARLPMPDSRLPINCYRNRNTNKQPSVVD